MSIEYPFFVEILSESEYVCSCTDCKKSPSKHSIFASFDELKAHLKMDWFICPDCEILKCMPMLTSSVNTHVMVYHPEKIISNELVYYCMKCDMYNQFKCFHCHECHMTFKDSAEITSHLKQEHTKFFPEFFCKYGLECRGYENGFCGFNHKLDTPFIEPGNVPNSFCSNEMLGYGKRCTEVFCSFDHFRGRVKWLLEQKKLKQQRHEMIIT
jgi:hypothetical protein